MPIADRLVKVTMQTVVLGVPAQGAITRDNVTLTVDAVVYFRVIDPVKALVNVLDYPHAVSQVSQTSLRTVIGHADLDTLLSDREQINAELKEVIDAPTEEPWGLLIERVEVKDIALPDSMKRSMSRQAEAERERRARVIAADGEFQASRKLAEAAQAMAATPGAHPGHALPGRAAALLRPGRQWLRRAVGGCGPDRRAAAAGADEDEAEGLG